MRRVEMQEESMTDMALALALAHIQQQIVALALPPRKRNLTAEAGEEKEVALPPRNLTAEEEVARRRE